MTASEKTEVAIFGDFRSGVVEVSVLTEYYASAHPIGTYT